MSTRITAPSDHRCVICGEGVRSKRTPLLKYTEESAMHIAVENYLDELVAFAATDWEARLRKLVRDWAPTGDYLSRVLKRCRTWSAASGALHRRELARRLGDFHVAHENCRLGAINACDMFVPHADLPRNPSKSSKPIIHESWKRAIGALLARPAELDSSPEALALGAEIARLGRILVPRPRSEAKRKGPVAARGKYPAGSRRSGATVVTRVVRTPMVYTPTLAALPVPPAPTATAMATATATASTTPSTKITLPIPASPAPSSSSSGAGAGASRPRRMSISNDPCTPTMPVMTRKRSRTDSFTNTDLDAELGSTATLPVWRPTAAEEDVSGAPPVTVHIKEEVKMKQERTAVMPVRVQHRAPHLQPLAPQAPTISPQPSYANIAGLASPSAFLTPPRPDVSSMAMPMEFSHSHHHHHHHHYHHQQQSSPSSSLPLPLPLPHTRPSLRRRKSDVPQPLQWEVSPEILKGLEKLELDFGALTPVASG